MTNIVLDMCKTTPEVKRMVVDSVQELADRGYRALGVAKTNSKSGDWEFLGVLSLFDPPREDTKETIAMAGTMGISVKMVTGDQVAIAKETCRALGMGAGILDSSCFHEISPRGLSEIVRDAHGFAEVYPEHKFEIVKMLMDGGFTCGMTGDGVNDAPALKRAHIGIAVEGATDAARAAADIVLTDPGLSTIIDAILRARKVS
jgi:H+-transporting ATPase